MVLRVRIRCSDLFYESDCQGQFSSSLIAFRHPSPLQSASSWSKPTAAWLHGWAEQSYAAFASSGARSILTDDFKRDRRSLDGVDHGSI